MKLSLQPITRAEAQAFIAAHHRHHRPAVGDKFCIGLNDGEKVVGVVVVGRPVARMLDDGFTAEVTRCCTDGTPHACSKLYAAAWCAARAMGYRKLITYTLPSEGGGLAARSRLAGSRQNGRWLMEPARAAAGGHAPA